MSAAAPSSIADLPRADQPGSGMRVYRVAPGGMVKNWRGDIYWLDEDELGLRLEDERGLPCAWLFYCLYESGEGPRPWLAQPYLYLYSAYVEPDMRGRGCFRRLTARMLTLHPRRFVCGMSVDSTGALERFFDAMYRARGRGRGRDCANARV